MTKALNPPPPHHGADGKTTPHTTDAVAWAKDFVQIAKLNPGLATDEGAMTTWFANAIMAGCDSARSPHTTEADALSVPVKLGQHPHRFYNWKMHFDGQWTAREEEIAHAAYIAGWYHRCNQSPDAFADDSPTTPADITVRDLKGEVVGHGTGEVEWKPVVILQDGQKEVLRFDREASAREFTAAHITPESPERIAARERAEAEAVLTALRPPAPQYRPWTAAEAIGKIVRHTVDGDFYVIVSADANRGYSAGALRFDFQQLVDQNPIPNSTALTAFNAWRQPDGSPCGVLITSTAK